MFSWQQSKRGSQASARMGGQAWGKTGTWKGGNAAEHASIVSRGVAIRRQGKVTGEGSVIHSQGGKKIFLSAESSVSSALGRRGGKKSLPNCYNPRFVRECCTPLDRALSPGSFASGNIMEKSDVPKAEQKAPSKERERERKKERNESVDVCFTTRVSTFFKLSVSRLPRHVRYRIFGHFESA